MTDRRHIANRTIFLVYMDHFKLTHYPGIRLPS
jgi:hypothetical protein